MKYRFGLHVLVAFSVCLYPGLAFAEESGSSGTKDNKKLEEIIVYGERVEATVSDTSVAITAMDNQFIDDMGLQGPDEMINFIPAATRTAWDIKIRGVGRNFRGLGGDPGIGTYYNGAYSPDFGIASTEGALYDVKRVEVLRGPQGTLYGRNSIGGVVNYVTNQPNPYDFEAQARVITGRYNTREFYGFVTGPMADDLAYRLVGSKRKRNGAIPGLMSEDVADVNDQNIALTLDWNVTDNFKINVRGNDRSSSNNGNFGAGGHGITSEGPCVGQYPITSPDQCDPKYRVPRDTNHYASGFRPVSAAYYSTYGDLSNDPRGAVPWIHPVTGAVVYGAYNRPGVDNVDKWPYMPTGNYMSPAVALYNIGDAEAPDIVSLTNNTDRENFDHAAGTLTADWDVSDRLGLQYIFAYQNFDYGFNRDNDYSNSLVGDNNDTDLESVDSVSHELRVFWQLGDRWTATSGFYKFWEDRDQLYGIRERAAQGRVSNPTLYGPDGDETLLLDALAMVAWTLPECMHYSEVPINAGPSVHPGYGKYCGDPAGRVKYDKINDTDAVYEQRNFVVNENLAFYTQGDLELTDTWRVTLGFRYSKDKRKGLEQRGGYSELNANDYTAWLPQAINLATLLYHPALYTTVDNGMLGRWPGVLSPTDPGAAPAPEVNGLDAMNVAMGNATWSGDPDFPITPVCALTDTTCAHPLRLEGIPISWGTRAGGEFKPDAQWSWRINFNWEPTDDILVYFGTTTGYRAGGWDLGGTDNRALVDTDGVGTCVNGGDDSGCDLVVLQTYDRERIISYELGYKGVHLDGTLQLNMALYYYDYTNYQDNVERWEDSNGSFSLPPITLPDGSPLGAPPGRGPVSVTTNVPKAVNKGFEVDGTYLVSDAFTVGGNYSYTISKYDSPFTFFNESDPRYPRSVFGGNLSENPCNMAPEIRALYCLEVDGFELQGIPKNKLSLWGSYEWYFEPGTLNLLGSYAYTGEYSTNAFNRPWDWVPARDRIDMRLTFREGTGRWDASLFVDNILDKTYIRTADMDLRLTGYGSNYPQRVIALYPRYWGVSFTYNFGAAAQ